MLILCKTGHMLEAIRPVPLDVLAEWQTQLFGHPATYVPNLYACAVCFTDRTTTEEYLGALTRAMPHTRAGETP
jgi:hypothetical protein